MPHKLYRLAIIIPVFNDWPSLNILLLELDKVAQSLEDHVSVFVVDDGSTLAPTVSHNAFVRLKAVELISLTCNLGHQRAIVTGICECLRRESYQNILIMDSDGEDSPTDISRLLLMQIRDESPAVVARRVKRSEGVIFRLCYTIYKRAFRWLTGEAIDFGNFCLLTAPTARRIVFMSDSWNHLAASIVKSRIPYTWIDSERANRITGSSTMNLVSLVMHGFSAISVFSDRVLTRLLLIFGLTSVAAIGCGMLAIILRFLTELAIPGWATNVFGLSCLLFFQSLTLLAVVVFSNLSNRSSVPFIPGLQSSSFILRVTKLYTAADHGDL